MDMRHYDAAIARWIVIDPVTHHDFSPYQAFDNNPVFWADPSGADFQTDQYGRDRFDKMGLFIRDADRGEKDYNYTANSNISTNSNSIPNESSGVIPFTTFQLFSMAAEHGKDKKEAGLAFEEAALRYWGLSPNKNIIFQSKKRKLLSGIGNVKPDALTDIKVYGFKFPELFTSRTLRNSSFHEVKASTGILFLNSGSSKYQILGLIEAASKSTEAGRYDRALLTFYTTANTFISPEVINYADKLGVKLRQSFAYQHTSDGSIFFTPPITLTKNKYKKKGNFATGTGSLPIHPTFGNKSVQIKF